MPAARSTRSRRLGVLALGVAVLAALWLLVPGAHDGLMYWSPLVLLVGLMLAGVRPDELVERFVRRTASARRGRRTVRSLGTARRSPVRVARSGLLIARSLATRPPPGALVAA